MANETPLIRIKITLKTKFRRNSDNFFANIKKRALSRKIGWINILFKKNTSRGLHLGMIG